MTIDECAKIVLETFLRHESDEKLNHSTNNDHTNTQVCSSRLISLPLGGVASGPATNGANLLVNLKCDNVVMVMTLC